MKILLVDDEPDTLHLYNLHLKLYLKTNFPYIIYLANNGQEAISKFQELKNKIDLIIMDYNMPIKDGITAMVEILKINPDQKIIIISADSVIKHKALENGAFHFFEKPFDFKEIFNLIISCVSI